MINAKLLVDFHSIRITVSLSIWYASERGMVSKLCGLLSCLKQVWLLLGKSCSLQKITHPRGPELQQLIYCWTIGAHFTEVSCQAISFRSFPAKWYCPHSSSQQTTWLGVNWATLLPNFKQLLQANLNWLSNPLFNVTFLPWSSFIIILLFGWT